MLELHELLDRFEILYPEVTALADLRRAVIDKDLNSIFRLSTFDQNEELRKAVVEENLHSIFRIMQNKTCHDVDTLYQYLETVRKAVTNKNIRSITRLLGDEDLGKLIVDQNMFKLPDVIDQHVKTEFTTAFKSFMINKIEYDKDCFSRGQLLSKQWLVNELQKLDLDLGVVFLCAGWYATLATMLFESDIKLERIHSFDIDPSCQQIAETFNKPWYLDEWRFKASTVDIHKMNYTTEPAPSDGSVGNFYFETENFSSGKHIETRLKPNTFINTSTEHILDFNDWYTGIPFGSLVIMQGNNYHDLDEHVNTHNSLADFSWMIHMRKPLFEGELDLGNYTRYMKIGFK